MSTRKNQQFQGPVLHRTRGNRHHLQIPIQVGVPRLLPIILQQHEVHTPEIHTLEGVIHCFKQHRQQSSTASDTSNSSLFKNVGPWGSKDGVTNDLGTGQVSNSRSSPNPPTTHRRTRSSFITSTFHGTPALQPLVSVPPGTAAQKSVPEFERQNSNVTVSMFRTPPLENNMVFNRMSSPNKSDNKLSLTLSASPQLHTLNKPRLHDIGLLHSRTIEHNRSLSWNTQSP